MWIFLLLPLLCSISLAERVSHQRVATADAFKLQCESMAYRSYAEGGICYFAIKNKITQDRGDLMCRNTFRGAKMLLERARERVLKLLLLEPSEYHDATSSGELNVLCAYDAQYSCDQGDLTLPGRCVVRSDKPITWKEASNFCRSKGASGVVIHNEVENLAISGLLWKDENGWLLPNRGDTWTSDDQTIDYWKWFFEGSFTPRDLKCSDDEQHAIIANNAKDTCAANGQWKVDHSTNKNIALCMREASCPFCPPPKKSADPDTGGEVTLPEIEEPTTTMVVSTTPPKPCYPLNDPPFQGDLWDLRYFYNWGRILHAFAANDEGIRAIMVNGIGYDRWSGSGSIGATISDAGYARIDQYCSDPEQKKHIHPMSFHKQGNSYHHYFGRAHIPFEIWVGYVSLVGGACGAKWPVRRWGCMVSQDAMYAGNLDGNTWYRGRATHVVFWLFDMNEGGRNAQRKGKPANCVDPPKENPTSKKPVLAAKPAFKNGPPKDAQMWALSYYYNWGRILHGFAANGAGRSTMQSQGIGYDGWNGAGVLGGTLSQAGYEKIKDFCDDPESIKHIKPMWFTKSGVAYYHSFDEKEIFVGYVSLMQGACGASKPIRRYTCLVSPDSMYAENLEGNTWYRGRAQEGGKVYFWLWPTGKGVGQD